MGDKDPIQVINPGIAASSIDQKVANSKSKNKNGKYVPYGIAGYVVNECSVVCPDCMGNEDNDYENNSPIFGNSEWDYLTAICEDCNKVLDVYHLVYESQNPEIHYKAVMGENMSQYDKLPTYPEIGEYVSNEAYSIGYSYGPSDLPPEATLEDIDIGMFTESANYINNIAPKLRALCGYQESKGGTYTQVPNDNAYHIFHEDCFPSFQEGYYDKAKELMGE
jgi:hypothetical protein